MPAFPTPTPIDLAINLPVGRIDVVAGDRSDTVVTVSPTNASKEADRRGAEDTKVVFDGSRLTITGPRARPIFIGPSESVDVKVELPAGSRLTAEISVGGVFTVGRLGATRIKNSTGIVELDITGDLWVRAGHGGVTLNRAEGGAEITADHGQIGIGTVTGDALLKASHGAISIGESGGDVEAKLSYGNLDIGTALASVTAKTAYGNITLREVSRGAISLESAYGQLSVGVRAGVPAWLDLSTKLGQVRSELDGERAPGPSEETVSIRARTQGGDILIRRAR